MRKIEKIILTAAVLLLSFMPFLWLKGNELILGYDVVYPLNVLSFLRDRLYSWTTTPGFGMDQSGAQGSLIIHFFDSIPLLLGLSPTLSQKIVFGFWFFAILVSSYIFIVRLEKFKIVESRYLRYFFPVLYAFNFYILQAWWAVERTKFSLVVAVPLILSIILPMVKETMTAKGVVRNALLCALIVSIFNGGSGRGVPLYGGLLIILGSFYLFFLAISFWHRSKKDILLLHLFFASFTVGFVLLNAYTLLPFFFSIIKKYSVLGETSGGMSGTIAWARYLSEDTSFLNLLRLQGIPDWYKTESHPYSSLYLSNPLLILSSFAFPFFLFLSFLTKKRENKITISFFLFLLLISLFFTVGTHRPLGFIFEFLMEKVPGFIVFRSPIFKFGYAYWLSASFLIALFLSGFIEFLQKKLTNRGWQQILGTGLSVIIISFLVVYHFPYLTGKIFRIDERPVTARVTVPSYIFDFSAWWVENGKTDKILLLPKLNDNWGMEQYRWGYMSLSPILENFANKNIIENTILLSSNEAELVKSLYESIDRQDDGEMDALTSVLGIRYFLVRNDFYHDLSDQETDDPHSIEEKLLKNKRLVRVATFGQWAVFKYTNEKPLIYAKSDAVLFSGTPKDMLSIEKENPIMLDTKAYLRNSQPFSDLFIYPDCVSCKAESIETGVIFPKPKILLDSPLYEFVQLKSHWQRRKVVSYDERIFRLVGETLKMAGQINELILLDRSEYHINIAREAYVKLLKSLSSELTRVGSDSANPYSTVIIVQQYLDAQNTYLNDIAPKVNRRSPLINLEKILYEINKLRDQLVNFYSENDFNIKKIYKFNLISSGAYEIKIDRQSLGSPVAWDSSKMAIFIDGEKVASSGARLDDKYLDFSKLFIPKGGHLLSLLLPSQESLLSAPETQSLTGSLCYISHVTSFSLQKTYRLSFQVKNNFDPNFFFFVDDGIAFSPILTANFPIAGERVKNNHYVISTTTLPISVTTKSLRIGFCAPGLNEQRYKENVKELSLVELTSPKVILHKAENQTFADPPSILIQEISQTNYQVTVENAKSPYYLIFTERYSPEWKASKGEQLMGNHFDNVWFVEQKGDYTVDIYYKPQKFFKVGLIISGISLILALVILLKREKRETYV